MPITYVLLISAFDKPLPQNTLQAYYQSEVCSKVKVCYLTNQNTPQLSSVQFIGNLGGLLAPIQAEDWLVIIYQGLYQKWGEDPGDYRLAAPFRDVSWLKEEDLVLPIISHYHHHQFRMLVMLEAFTVDTELALHHAAWRDLPVVVVVGQRIGNPEQEDERGQSLLGSVCKYLGDIETNLVKREKPGPSIVECYVSIKQEMNEAYWSMEDECEQSNCEDQSDESSSQSDDRIELRLYYSQLGQALLKDQFPL